MNAKLLIKILLTITLFVMMTSCGATSEPPAEVAFNDDSTPVQTPTEAPTQAPTEAPTQAPAVGFTPSSKCLVPDVVGLDQFAAKGSLAHEGLQPVSSNEYNDLIAVGAVISQEPSAGTTLEPCQGDVVIIVSLGPVPVPTETPHPTDTPAPPTAIPTNTPLPTKTQPPPTPTPHSDLIPFASPNDPNALNPILGWQPGSSQASSYDLTLNPGVLTLITGSRTDQWERLNTAPLITYPYEGNFEAQVKVLFSPDYNFAQAAGLGVRSMQDNTTWLRIIRGFGEGQQRVGVEATRQGKPSYTHIPYSENAIYLNIKRQGFLFTLSYSTNGSNWEPLKNNYVFEIPSDVQIYLVVLSAGNEGITAQFSDFIVSHK